MLEIGPGFTKSSRIVRLTPMRSSSTVAMQVKTTASFRMERRVRRGRHFGIALQQEPSGSGPFSHFPPPDFGRVQE